MGQLKLNSQFFWNKLIVLIVFKKPVLILFQYNALRRSIYYLDERYDDVISYAIPILKTSKQQYEAEMLSLIAASYFAKSDYVNAEKYFREFYAKDKSNNKNNLFIYQYGYSLFELKKYSESVTVLEKLDNDDVYLQSGMDAGLQQKERSR